MKKTPRSARNLLLCVAMSQAVRPLANLLFDQSLQWQSHDATMHLSLVIVIWLAASLVPNRKVAFKCIAFGWLGFEVVGLVESIANIWDVRFPTYTVAVHSLAVGMLSSWYWLRRPVFSDALDDTHLFICRLKPRSAQDIAIAMFGRAPLGGIAIYYRGQFWHYRRGTLVCSNFENPSKYVSIRAGIPAQSTIASLNNLIGSKWSIRRNCMTTLYATVKKPDFLMN